MSQKSISVIVSIALACAAAPAFAKDKEKEKDKQKEKQKGGGGGGGGQTGKVTAKVTGPVEFDLEIITGDVQISASTKDLVEVSAQGCGPDEIELDQDGNELSVEFDPVGSCHGPVKVLLPAGSSVEAEVVEGDVTLTGSYKYVEISAISGDVAVESAERVEVEAVQGKVTITKVSQRVDVESVSGDVQIGTTGVAPTVSVETVSGNLTWSGQCGKGCRIGVESYQGQVTLGFDKSSSFELRYASHSGSLKDSLKMTVESQKKNVMGAAPVRAKYGAAEGVVRVETFQGDLVTRPR